MREEFGCGDVRAGLIYSRCDSPVSPEGEGEMLAEIQASPLGGGVRWCKNVFF